MTGTLYRLLKERRKEAEAIESAGGKQSAWSKIGMGLGGLLAMGLTGGAATPLVAAMMAGGGTLAGGLIGRGLARGTKGGRIDKATGRFFKDEGKDLMKTIGSNIWSGAAKSALGAGLTSLGGSISLGKEGLKLGNIGSVGKEGAKFNLSNLWDKPATAAAGGYSDSLWGKLGKAIDYKGSFIGKGIGQLQSWQTGRELQAMGEASLGGGPSFAEGTGRSVKYPRAAWEIEPGKTIGSGSIGPPRRHAQVIPGEMTAIMEGNISPQSKIDMSATAAAAEAPIFGGEFDADRYRILKEGEDLRAAKVLDQEQNLLQIQETTKQQALEEISNLKQQEMNLVMAELNAQKKAGTGYGAFDRWIRGYGDTSQSEGLFDIYQEGLARTNAVSLGQYQAGSRYYMPGNISPEHDSAASLLMRRNR